MLWSSVIFSRRHYADSGGRIDGFWYLRFLLLNGESHGLGLRMPPRTPTQHHRQGAGTPCRGSAYADKTLITLTFDHRDRRMHSARGVRGPGHAMLPGNATTDRGTGRMPLAANIRLYAYEYGGTKLLRLRRRRVRTVDMDGLRLR